MNGRLQLRESTKTADATPAPVPPLSAHLYGSPSFHTRINMPLSDGADGTFEALALMAECVRGECGPDYSGMADEANYRAAETILKQGGSDGERIIPALFYFVRDSIEYIDHPWNVQQVQDCRRTIELGTGDCVSKSVCLATLLGSRGIVSRFVAQCLDGREYSHVYVEAWDGSQWVALDPVADGRGGRDSGGLGWRQRVPDYGFESEYEIF